MPAINDNLKRDFTYIDDIISGTQAGIDKNYKCEVFNLGNHRSELLMDMIALIEKELGQNASIDFQPMQPGDLKESFADIKHAINRLKFKPEIGIERGISLFIKWYKEYYSIN